MENTRTVIRAYEGHYKEFPLPVAIGGRRGLDLQHASDNVFHAFASIRSAMKDEQNTDWRLVEVGRRWIRPHIDLDTSYSQFTEQRLLIKNENTKC
jgi:hypothetical protein